MKDPKIKYDNDWEQVFVREKWTFPFGSLMSAWATINQGKDISINDFIAQAKILHKESMLMIENALIRSQITEEEKQELSDGIRTIKLDKEGNPISTELGEKWQKNYDAECKQQEIKETLPPNGWKQV